MSGVEDSVECSNIMDELEKKFKQERKELQAKIQGLKKSATKGDKKKKKEIQEEIAKLEADIDRHQKEEEEKLRQTSSLLDPSVNDGFDIKTETAADRNLENEEVPSSRVSKAEKRRQKKVAANKDREARIQDQEEENLHGPRHKEMVAILKKLQDRGLAIHGIEADGNCLYSAVEHQLKESGSLHSEMCFKDLRKLTADYLRQNSNEFLPFLSNDNTGDPMSKKEFDEYCRKVEKTTAWGGQIELRALSDALKCSIEVIQATGSPMTIGEQYLSESKKPLIVTFHRHLYRLGEHYNSVVPHIENDVQNSES